MYLPVLSRPETKSPSSGTRIISFLTNLRYHYVHNIKPMSTIVEKTLTVQVISISSSLSSARPAWSPNRWRLCTCRRHCRTSSPCSEARGASWEISSVFRRSEGRNWLDGFEVVQEYFPDAVVGKVFVAEAERYVIPANIYTTTATRKSTFKFEFASFEEQVRNTVGKYLDAWTEEQLSSLGITTTYDDWIVMENGFGWHDKGFLTSTSQSRSISSFWEAG
ncbi:uncharacterized protein RAG0_05597 [Rhynchosporium agropyri]|uniref:Uncharacterized protein n=1 Tax=Rhynchosporium agropyri TaxID=914238 RepID=A0A1E1KDN1_9HELO|nr:uncharacterized protein RAG0_05597 [Rhynchosporium agropyri]